MATVSEVKAGLDDISTVIRNADKAFARSKAAIQGARNELANIPTVFSEVIAEIDGYAPSGAFETLAKDEKEKMQAEFIALRDEMDLLIANF